MNQSAKLKTVTPSSRKDSQEIGLEPLPQQDQPSRTDHLSIDPGSSTHRVSETHPVQISVRQSAKASVAFFSIQNLLAMLPSWSVSLVGHTALLLVLAAIVTVPVSDSSMLSIDAFVVDASVNPELDEMLVDNDQTEVDLLNVDVEALNSEASENTADLFRDDGLEVSLLEGNADGIGLEAVAQTGLTPLETSDEGGVKGTEGTSTQFFGTEATGDRFVFIIDASDSMNEGVRWHKALRELEKSVDKLTEKQRVMVLLYNFQTFPMFDTPPEKLDLLPVTDEFKNSLKQWLSVQVPVGGTRPAHALRYSLTLKPDAIFLLSDGLLADNSIQVLAQENTVVEGRKRIPVVPVHTVSLGPHIEGAELMKFIADKNDGEFSWVR